MGRGHRSERSPSPDDRRKSDKSKHPEKKKRERTPSSDSSSTDEQKRHKSKHSRRDRSPSTSSSSDDSRRKQSKRSDRGRDKPSDDDKMRDKRLREKEKEKEAKLIRKMLETPEERRRRRLEKKETKRLKSKEKEKANELCGYTNDTNPFGDPNLLTPFQWRKKNEIVAKHLGISEDQVAKQHAQNRHSAVRDELEKARRRREERLAEQQRWEEERARMAREAEGMDAYEMEAKEELFHREQAKLRSEIRLRENRAKPIDILAKNLELSDEFDVEMNEPYKIFRGLSLLDLEDLMKDIQVRISFGQALEFWESLSIVCEDEVSNLRTVAQAEGDSRFGITGMHSVIEGDVVQELGKLSAENLSNMEKSIREKLSQGEVDSDYWEALLKRVVVQRAKAKLRDIHVELLRKRLLALQKKQKEREVEMASRVTSVDVEELQRFEEALARSDAAALEERRTNAETIMTNILDADNEDPSVICASPVLIHSLGPDEFAVDPSDDEKELEANRRAVLARLAREKDPTLVSKDSKDFVSAEASRGMGDGESAFNIEHQLSMVPAAWADKYRPRKPRYFNRVQTGFEWTKYNQTHYDHDNPPPKVVMGYKFNVFYPDLIDPSSTPKYFLQDGDNPDTKIIRFHAGPPYEDIAFTIVNKEWELSRRSGFKCTFERGVLHLYFNFVRLRYRK